jgi:LacI family transcriptional regulator
MASSRRAGIRDVAREAGVAIATVSRVLSGNPTVASELRERVLAAAARLDYQPNPLAQGLRKGRSHAVGFITDDLANPLTAMIASGAESVFRSSGLALIVMNSEHDPEIEVAHLRFLRARRVDGVLITPAWDYHPATAAALREMGLPVVLIEAEMPLEVGASVVVSDHRSGVREAVARLVELGHRRFGVLPGPLRYRAGRERMAGATEAAALSGDVIVEYVECELDAAEGQIAAERLLEDTPGITALIVGGNQMLEGVLSALKSRGLRPGPDIALVTSDDVAINRVHQPPLTAVARDAFGLGRTAASILIRQLAADVAPETVILPTTVIWRDTGPAGAPQLTREPAAAPGGERV